KRPSSLQPQRTLRRRPVMNDRALFFSIIFLALFPATRGAVAADLPTAEIRLPDLVREALERNPEVQMAARMVEAKHAHVPQAGALPDPVLMYGVENEGRPVPFETLGTGGFSDVYVGFTQEIPFHGKRAPRDNRGGPSAAPAQDRAGTFGPAGASPRNPARGQPG